MTIESNALELPQSKTNAASHGLAKTGEQKLFRSFFCTQEHPRRRRTRTIASRAGGSKRERKQSPQQHVRHPRAATSQPTIMRQSTDSVSLCHPAPPNQRCPTPAAEYESPVKPFGVASIVIGITIPSGARNTDNRRLEPATWSARGGRWRKVPSRSPERRFDPTRAPSHAARAA